MEGGIRSQVRKLDMDQSVDEVVNLDSLASAEVVKADEVFSVFPDENTSERLYNGIPFKDLPYVLLLLHRNNTRLIAR